MKKSKFTEQQIVFALRQAENGVKVSEVCRKMDIHEATFYNWKKKCGGLRVSKLRNALRLNLNLCLILVSKKSKPLEIQEVLIFNCGPDGTAIMVYSSLPHYTLKL